MTNQEIRTIIQENRFATELYSRYLNYTPRLLCDGTVESFSKECGLSVEEGFLALFSAACGLESDENKWHRHIERTYLAPCIQCLDVCSFQEDAYYKAVHFPTVENGQWKLCTESFLPFEPFVRNDPLLTEELRELPQIGYFKEEFKFPSVLENGVEWMTVTPNEIETMRAPIANAGGRVLTLGLGLGYFAFHASQKENVESVTVIERDEKVISLFCEHLLEQFPHKEKIHIIKDDAFAFLKGMRTDAFDYLFADLWHDASDGLEMYLRIKHIAKERGFSFPVDYWIEPSLLSALRLMVFEKLCESPSLQKADAKKLLSNEFLRELAPDIQKL